MEPSLSIPFFHLFPCFAKHTVLQLKSERSIFSLQVYKVKRSLEGATLFGLVGLIFFSIGYVY